MASHYRVSVIVSAINWEINFIQYCNEVYSMRHLLTSIRSDKLHLSVIFVLLSVIFVLLSVIFVLLSVIFVLLSVIFVLLSVIFVLLSVIFVLLSVIFVLLSVIFVLLSVIFVLLSVIFVLFPLFQILLLQPTTMPGWHRGLECWLSSMLTNALWVRSQPGTVNFVLSVCCCAWLIASLRYQEYSCIHMGELTVWIVFPSVAIRMYRSSPLVPLDSCLTAAACLSSAC